MIGRKMKQKNPMIRTNGMPNQAPKENQEINEIKEINKVMNPETESECISYMLYLCR